jgi:hypothetical protein
VTDILTNDEISLLRSLEKKSRTITGNLTHKRYNRLETKGYIKRLSQSPSMQDILYEITDAGKAALRMDPEDLREVISASQKRVPKTVQRFDGFVARYMGDGVLVYFGYPRAHEDDAERAVQAGLELVRVVTALSLKICEV